MPAPYTAFTYTQPATTPYITNGFASATGALPAWGAWDFSAAIVGVSFSESWDMPNCPPVSYAILSGALPPGLALDTLGRTKAKLYGTPTTAGTYTFTLRATNENGFADQAFSMTVSIGTAVGLQLGGSYTFIL